MKKVYIKPNVEVVRIETANMIASSYGEGGGQCSCPQFDDYGGCIGCPGDCGCGGC